MSSTFADLGVPSRLLTVLDKAGITVPTPIQKASLPDSLSGRDVLGRGRTGSGKTYAFSIPLVAGIAAAGGLSRPKRPRGLVLAPTRELASQILETLEPLATAAGLTTTVIFGGVSQKRQVDALARGVDIVVACPGRLEDLIGQDLCSLADVQISVLDEADHMADLGFLPGVTRLLASTPADGRRLLFSATLDRGVDKLVRRFLTSPAVHEVDSGAPVTELTDHHVLQVAHGQRLPVLADLLAAGQRTIVFTRTKHAAKRLAQQLNKLGVPSVDLHGNLSQNARVRHLDAFSSGRATALVATDIAARGIHVDGVELVIHADPPVEHKAYVHRSGRTGRAGAKGLVLTLATDDQKRDVRGLFRAAGIKPVSTVKAEAGAAVLSELVPGERAYPGAVEIIVPGRDTNQSSGGRRSGGGRSGGGHSGGGQRGGSRSGGRRSRGGQRGGDRSGASRSTERNGRSNGGQRAGGGGPGTPAGRASSSRGGGRRRVSRPQGA